MPTHLDLWSKDLARARAAVNVTAVNVSKERLEWLGRLCTAAIELAAHPQENAARDALALILHEEASDA